MSISGGGTASQAWAILKRHARDELGPLRLQELCKDNDRVSSLVTVHNAETQSGDPNFDSEEGISGIVENHMLMVDLSRQRMTLETLNHLLRLGRARGVPQFVQRLAWGPTNDPPSKDISPIPSYHLTLRAPVGSTMLLKDGSNALTSIHKDWNRIQSLSDQLRRGQQPGITGQMIRDVVVVGVGTPMLALRFLYTALSSDTQARLGQQAGLPRTRQGVQPRRMRFVTSVDPLRIQSAVSDLDPSTTLVLNIALTGGEETMAATELLKSWLVQTLGNGGSSSLGRKPHHVWAKHVVWVTANPAMATSSSNLKSQSKAVFVVPKHAACEAFTTFTAATLLPLATVFGWAQVNMLLQGAHNMDKHFVETNPRHNLPILLALTDVWNDSCLQSAGRVVSPCTEALESYPSFCATLEAQTCSRATPSLHGSPSRQVAAAQVIDGGLFNSYDRALYQSQPNKQPQELILTLDSQLDTKLNSISWMSTNATQVQAAQDSLLCSIFAHADELAFGGSAAAANTASTRVTSAGEPSSEQSSSEGNRPSTLILCSKLGAFCCGQLIALAEHRALVKSYLWEKDPFVQQFGSSIHNARLANLQERLQQMIVSGVEEDDDDGNTGDPNRLNLSTKTILEHYSNLVRETR